MGETINDARDWGDVLTQDWVQKAARELHESPETRREKIFELRNMIERKGGLVGQTDDAYLLKFLRARKFNVLKAFNMMERYEVMTKAHPDLYNLQKVADNLDIFNYQGQNFLDGRDRTGAKIFLYKVGQFNISQNPRKGQVSIEDIFRSNMLCLEWSLLETKTQIAGVSILADMSGFRLASHACLLSPYYSRRTAELIQETFPLRFKGFHIVNQPLYFDALFAVVKPFIKDKIKQRVILHGNNFKSLHKYMSPDVLPAEYGGTAPTCDNTKWKQQLIKDLPSLIKRSK